MVASPAFSEPKHRLNCFQNKSEKQSQSYCFGSEILPNGYILIIAFFAIKDVFNFLDIQKLKYAAAYFAYTQARPWHADKCLYFQQFHMLTHAAYPFNSSVQRVIDQ